MCDSDVCVSRLLSGQENIFGVLVMKKTLTELRGLDSMMFKETALKVDSKQHGVVWAQTVFSLAGFRESVFNHVIRVEDVELKKLLTTAEKERIIALVIRIASSAKVDKGGYKWHHPVYGEGATRNRGEIVGKCLSISIAKKGLLILTGPCSMEPDPMDDKLFIVKQGAKDAHVRKVDIIGFWSNWMETPVKNTKQVNEVFEIK